MPKLPAPPDTLSPTAQLVSAAQQQGPKLGVKDVLFILDYFYAIHYRFGMELEQAMSLGHLSRIQAAVIWIVQFRVDAAGWVKRKEVELALKSWFECSGARASKLLYELSSPPLSLIRQVPNPDSRREKIISLTPCGTRFFWDMQKAGKMFFANYFESMSPRELKQGIRFFGLAFDPHSPEVAAATRLASLPVNGVQGLNNSCKGKENQDINEVIRSKHRSETLDKALTFFIQFIIKLG